LETLFQVDAECDVVLTKIMDSLYSVIEQNGGSSVEYFNSYTRRYCKLWTKIFLYVFKIFIFSKKYISLMQSLYDTPGDEKFGVVQEVNNCNNKSFSTFDTIFSLPPKESRQSAPLYREGKQSIIN